MRKWRIIPLLGSLRVQGDILSVHAVTKGRNEYGIDNIDERLARPPRLIECLPRAPECFQISEDRLHQRRIAAPKSVDGLFDVAYPIDLLGELGQPKKQCKLNGTRILKLIDHQQVEFITQCFGDEGVV